ncbi:MAG: 50S ribosomal protein L1 [Rickettsiales bacterium]|nr:50S ribosomal protein L1 [Rickettsiales bacterium]OUT45614.1 MAG: 50S ribosomal protein L1 [Pelagibacteraceae bacterium TMED13]
MKLTKKNKIILNEIKDDMIFKIEEAISTSKKFASKNFDETLDVTVVLGIDAKKSDQQIRGVISLPKMPAKKIKVAVFADGDDLKKAKDSGADIVGAEELVEKVKNGEINFDKCIATPKMMSKVSVLGQILGPKGLMPNPKLGTVTNDLAAAIKNIKSGQVEYKTDKAGLIHAPIGKISFSDDELKKNIVFFLDELKKKKPENSKGVFIKKFFITSTMGPGLQVDSTSVM